MTLQKQTLPIKPMKTGLAEAIEEACFLFMSQDKAFTTSNQEALRLMANHAPEIKQAAFMEYVKLIIVRDSMQDHDIGRSAGKPEQVQAYQTIYRDISSRLVLNSHVTDIASFAGRQLLEEYYRYIAELFPHPTERIPEVYKTLIGFKDKPDPDFPELS